MQGVSVLRRKFYYNSLMWIAVNKVAFALMFENKTIFICIIFIIDGYAIVKNAKDGHAMPN